MKERKAALRELGCVCVCVLGLLSVCLVWFVCLRCVLRVCVCA